MVSKGYSVATLTRKLLVAFLNSVFAGRKTIVDLEYNKNEHPGETKQDGAAIFDLTCTGNDGERFILEVQRGNQTNFKQRVIFYTSVLAAAQAPKGGRSGWAYELPDIYLIALLEDFSVDVSNGRYVQDICLSNRDTGQVFYDGLGYIFLELVNFAKTEDELESVLDKWLYVLKHISRMDKMPLFLRKTIFEKVFSIAEYSNMTKEDKVMYDSALKRKWDNQSVLEYAIMKASEKASEKTREEERTIAEAEKRNTAIKIKLLGVPLATIAEGLGFSIEELEQL